MIKCSHTLTHYSYIIIMFVAYICGNIGSQADDKDIQVICVASSSF